ncbi:hypothetical protein [Chryseobacterium sp. 3008163]|uniref:hypothetical protein n=1 Tax=Chryseobacterium sp. 3008163 TaxID=2478663 RepID=UPI001E6180B3
MNLNRYNRQIILPDFGVSAQEKSPIHLYWWSAQVDWDARFSRYWCLRALG